jgi:hypothetical protein
MKRNKESIMNLALIKLKGEKREDDAGEIYCKGGMHQPPAKYASN